VEGKQTPLHNPVPDDQIFFQALEAIEKNIYDNKRDLTEAVKKAIIKAEIESEELDMARDKSKDVELSTSLFEIDEKNKTFSIDLTNAVFSTAAMPWVQASDTEIAKKEKSNLPRIKLVSETTGKDASFVLHERNGEAYIFMPSFGTLINKTKAPQIRGWKLIIRRAP
jgi:hypothetical protein